MEVDEKCHAEEGRKENSYHVTLRSTAKLVMRVKFDS